MLSSYQVFTPQPLIESGHDGGLLTWRLSARLDTKLDGEVAVGINPFDAITSRAEAGSFRKVRVVVEGRAMLDLGHHRSTASRKVRECWQARVVYIGQLKGGVPELLEHLVTDALEAVGQDGLVPDRQGRPLPVAKL
jgi:hypothetical protein